MSRSRDDKGRLAYIECDGCDAKIRPGPDIAESGWMKCGTIEGWFAVATQYDYCPDCSKCGVVALVFE